MTAIDSDPDSRREEPQLRRLCALPPDVCEAAVADLVQSGFLWKTGEGTFLRRRLA
jgi:hypothetical protein